MLSRNLIRGCLAVFGCLVALPAIALADGVPPDPQILIDLGGESTGISGGITTIQPDGTDPLTFDFFNDTGNIITGFTFLVQLNTGLSAAQIALFSCPTSGFFLSTDCSHYNSDTGILPFIFSGVNPSDGDEFCPIGAEFCDSEFGEQEGIPVNGHFLVTLNGWTRNLAGGSIYGDLPTFQNSFTTAPEPSMIPILAGGVLLIAVFARRFRRRELQSPN